MNMLNQFLINNVKKFIKLLKDIKIYGEYKKKSNKKAFNIV